MWLPRLAAVVAVALGPAIAQADESLHASLGLTSGYSDNILGAASNPTNFDTAPPVQSDLFTTVAPGLLFAHEGKRIVQTARYTWEARLYESHSEANSYASNLRYQAMVSLSPTSEVGVLIAAVNGRTNTFEFAEDAPLQNQPNGDVAFASGSIGAFYQRDISRDWRLRDQAAAAGFIPVDSTANLGSNYTLANALSLERSLGYDAVSGLFRTTYSSFERRDDQNMQIGRDAVVFAGPEVRWLHDISPSLASDVAAGLQLSVRANDYKRGSVLPIAQAYLRYVRDLAQVAVGWRHTVETNILAAETSLNHLFEVRGGVPFGTEERLILSGRAGYGFGRFLDLEEQSLVGRSEFLVIESSLAWKISDSLLLSLRYGSRRQVRDRPPLADSELTVRRDLMLTVTGRYPSREAARMPSRDGTRADRSDEIDADLVGGKSRPGR